MLRKFITYDKQHPLTITGLVLPVIIVILCLVYQY
jgi:hypothetical protein